mmetsp:Transcript_11610/g.20593  ORF Transcript_11610/g.20593 Transcript_11610/m.20593 type:complete len:321 (-) Transcript_11610:272-1234(-)
MSTNTSSTPFDLKQLQEAMEKAPSPPDPIMVTASDGAQLAVRVYSPTSAAKAILIFYHGGGAHSGAGYQMLAQQLATEEYGIQVYTPDIRGHGQSEGPRGDTPNPEQVYEDVDALLEFAKKDHSSDHNIPIFLGGHSSGAGLMLQYATYANENNSNNQISVEGYLLVAPQLGPNANVATPKADLFARVSILPFILNGIFGVMGHNPAVQFAYSEEVLEQSGNIPYLTVNMGNAVSPMAPAQQLSAMKNVKIWTGQEDELFDADKMHELYSSVVSAGVDIIGTRSPDDDHQHRHNTHLGILLEAHLFMGPWLVEQLVQTTK